MSYKLCPKCGSLSGFHSYFQKWMCNTCEHQWIENKNIIKAKLINTTDPIFLPCRKNPKDAGADLRARIPHNISLTPGQLAKLPTGIGMEIPEGHVGVVSARSGATTEGKVTLIRIIDSGYRGEICLNVINMDKRLVEIVPTERLAQIVIIPCYLAEFIQVEELAESERGTLLI
jgi:dUTP pyrophosphatase